MHGAIIRDLLETSAMRSARGNQTPSPFLIGTLKSYNSADNTVDVYFPHVDPTLTQSTRMPLLTGWAGANYGEQAGPEPGVQLLIASVGVDSDDYVALGFLYTVNQQPPVAPTKEWWVVDDNASSFKLTQNGKGSSDGQGAAKVTGDQYASVTAGTLVEIGAENLNATTNAATNQQYLQQAVNAVIAAAQTAINTLAARVQGGSGVAPPTIGTVTANGSATVLVES